MAVRSTKAPSICRWKLTVDAVPDEFEFGAVVDIQPETNTSLEGLYRSRTMYCTQCEAEGYRKITFGLDRPDVLSTTP